MREEGQEAVLPSRSYYDGQGRYLIPGYIDTHMHIESTMMIPENLARAILPWGTTTVCTDPHEIGNVMGLDGVRFMLENAKKSKLRQYVLAPSCVPSLPGMENAGAEFHAEEVGELLDMDDVVGIAEIMDYVGVMHDSERMHTIIDEGLRRGMFLQGHAPYCSGRELAAYLIGGPVSDHESVNADEVRGKLRAGMHVNLRASSLIDNLSFLVDGCKDQPWRDFVSVCTDDVHAKDLLTVGHINNVVRKAVASGLDGREVVKMATLNAAREYGFDDLGAIAPGGRLLPPEQAPAALRRHLTRDADGNGCFHLTPEVSLTAADVRNLQFAKAAVAAGIRVLLQQRSLTPGQLDGVYLAGGFGSYLDPESAAAIGMLPRTCAGKLRTLGNTALTGAAALTLDGAQWQRIRAISRACSYLELSGRADFAAAFTENLSFPQP